ncbi:MAG: hypothetical protein ABSA97_04055 [Verrucomicrobiia bacterium]
MKSWLRMVVVVLGVGLVVAVESGGGTSDVFQLHTLIQGVVEFGGLASNSVIRPVQIRDVDLINLGLGSPLGTPVPPNERLALVNECPSNDMRIIIYDTSTSSNLMTIGYMQTLSAIEGLRRKTLTRNVISDLTFVFAQNVSNGLAGGSFFVNGNLTTTASNGCMTKFSGQIIGALGTSFFFTNNIVTNIVDLMVTNTVTNTYYVISNFTVNVANTSMTTQGKKLGTLIEP